MTSQAMNSWPGCTTLRWNSRSWSSPPASRLRASSSNRSASIRRKDYSDYHRVLDRIFAPLSAKPRVAVECDSVSSLILEVEAGRGIAVVTEVLKRVAGKRLLYRPLTGTTEAPAVGIARATNGDVTPAGERLCKILRQISRGAQPARPKQARYF